jgi:class 3 adenylate cyclase/tetratricopeptide (TPR) repeat protein
MVVAGSKFCDNCGNPVAVSSAAEAGLLSLPSPRSYTPQHLAEKILTGRSALEGERRQVTVLFCDVVDSTRLAGRLGAEAMHALLNRLFELWLREVHRYEGTINQFLGDGFMALFGAPLTCEEHARCAVLAALGIHQRLREHAADVPPGFSVRMGLNTGLVVIGRIGDNLWMDYTAIGDTTNLAARLQQLAEPGSVYVGEATYRITKDRFDYQVLPRRTVKGFSDPLTSYRALRARTPAAVERMRAEQGIGSALVGRGVELAEMERWIEGVIAGQGLVAFIIGEAGLGKSRLVAEMRRRIHGREVRWLEGRGLSFTKTLSYLPFVGIIKSWAGIEEETSEAESWARLERGLGDLFGGEADEISPYLATLLGVKVGDRLRQRVEFIEPRAMGGQIFQASRRFFERLARERPLVLILEDLHWVDQSSIELLEHLLPLVESVPLLICCLGRPEPDGPATRFSARVMEQHPTRVAITMLAPLSEGASEELLGNLLGTAVGLLPDLRALVLEKAEGNPFFVEEVVRALVDTGVLVRDGPAGSWRLTTDIERIAIPSTIEGVIMARIDRLAEDVKGILKLAAVIGRQFLYRVLRAIAPTENPELDLCLGELEKLELIRQKRRFPELEYIFKHALVQAASYESILVKRRRELHRNVAGAIERLFPDRLEEFYGILAYHYARAEDWEHAQHYLFRAGDQAGRIAADSEALSHYREAISAYERVFGDRWDPAQRAGLERRVGEALFRRGEHEQAIEYLRQAVGRLGFKYPRSSFGVRVAILAQTLRQVGHRLVPATFLDRSRTGADAVSIETSRLFEAMAWIDYFVDQERFVLDTLLELNDCEAKGYEEGVIVGQMAIGVVLDHVGLLRLSRPYFRRGMALAHARQQPIALAFAHFGQGMHEHHALGEFEAAGASYQRAASLWREAGDLRRWGAATYSVAWVLRLRGRVDASLEHGRELIKVGENAADHHVLAWGYHACGRTLLQQGQVMEAQSLLERAVALFGSVPDYNSVQCATSDLGHAYLRLGRIDEALVRFEESMTLIAARGFRGFLCVSALNGRAEAYVRLIEQAGALQRSVAVGRAWRACRAAVRQGRLNPEGFPGAVRLRGTCEWLAKRRRAARRSWNASLEAAARMGLRHEVGLTLLEMGRWTRDGEYLRRAESVLEEIGTQDGVAKARALLDGAPDLQ